MIRKYSPYVWIDKKIIPRQEAKISLFAHSILYGDGVFEGIKIYKCSDGRFAIFRLDDHLKRLFNSVSVIGLKITFTPEEIKQAVIDTAKKNIPEGDYVRPLVFVDEENPESAPHSNPVRLAILMWEWEPYWGPEASRNGISVAISKWRRFNSVMPFRAKITGNYVNAMLAKKEAKKRGFQEALIKDENGRIVEASASNIFIVKNGKLITPSWSAPILKGITRDTVIYLGRDKLGLTVVEDFFDSESVYEADEAFLTNTSGEIAPIKDLEVEPIGKLCPGPVTQILQSVFFKLTRGEMTDYHPEWLTYVE